MTGRRPVAAGTRPVVRKATGREPDCYLCEGPISYQQIIVIPEHQVTWVHMGCEYDAQKVRAGQLPMFPRSR
jgi:hypothetical protein